MIYVMSVGVAVAPMIRLIIIGSAKTSRPAMVVMASVILALYAGLGYMIYRGRNWARTLFTVLWIVGAAMMFIGMTPRPTIPPPTAITWIQNALSLVCLALLYVKSSRDWFAQTRAGGL